MLILQLKLRSSVVVVGLLVFSLPVFFFPFYAEGGGAVAQQKSPPASVQQQVAQQAARQVQVQRRQQEIMIHQKIQVQGGQIRTDAAQGLAKEIQNAAQTQEIVELSDIWKVLESSSQVWPLMIDREPKEATVVYFIEMYQKQGITIRNPPAQYVQSIDSLAIQNREMMNRPFKELLQVAAIMDYDFDNGQDKEGMALRLLGRQGYLENKKRLGF